MVDLQGNQTPYDLHANNFVQADSITVGDAVLASLLLLKFGLFRLLRLFQLECMPISSVYTHLQH